MFATGIHKDVADVIASLSLFFHQVNKICGCSPARKTNYMSYAHLRNSDNSLKRSINIP
ncbi:hypothetical protein ECSTECC16502_1199 [Escherichia coli STEC_C165-02]|nr:hypothetical protein ECSTECC16502_1199 [Escherichia coli STEC_C165-02]